MRRHNIWLELLEQKHGVVPDDEPWDETWWARMGPLGPAGDPFGATSLLPKPPPVKVTLKATPRPRPVRVDVD